MIACFGIMIFIETVDTKDLGLKFLKERLQKVLSAYGIASRRAAEEIIAAGRVTVNGIPASVGDGADPETDVILVDGKRLAKDSGERVYIALNKPTGYVTTMMDEKGRKTVRDLTTDVGVKVYPVGRLDLNSMGLLLMTNDGELTNKLTHPRHEVEKEYIVGVAQDVAAAAEKMALPMEIDGYPIRAARVRVVRNDETGHILSVTIREGRNRQVRKMCMQCGLTVKWLLRIRVGEIHLGDLPKGTWRYLTEDEISYLKTI